MKGRRKYHRWFRKAVRKRDRETVQRIIRRFPELHHEVIEGGTLLDQLRGEDLELLEAAFQAGLGPDPSPARGGDYTLLHHAAGNGSLDLVLLVLRYGADAERRNEWGEVALGYACSWGHLEIVALVEAGADVNAIELDPGTGYRNTPLDCTHQYPEIAAYLRGRGAKYLVELEGGPEAG